MISSFKHAEAFPQFFNLHDGLQCKTPGCPVSALHCILKRALYPTIGRENKEKWEIATVPGLDRQKPERG